MSLSRLEEACITAHRRGQRLDWNMWAEDDHQRWVAFCLAFLFKVGKRVRELRFAPLADHVHYKDDGSPATDFEQEFELLLGQELALFDADVAVVGEETGGELPGHGLAVAIDPIDGTWSFLGRLESHATSLAVFRDGQPIVGMVANACTAEIGYAAEGTGARLLQLSAMGEADLALPLPIERVRPDSVLVNIQPNRHARAWIAELYQGWDDNDLRLVRSPSGAPTWALLEAAKGSYVYVNRWSQRRSEPYDLAAGIMLVRGAGGEVTNLDDEPIDGCGHAGPFVAAVDARARQAVTRRLRALAST